MPWTFDKDPDGETPCAVCGIRKYAHGDVLGDHDWMDREDHGTSARTHQPPNDDAANCDTCQSLAEAQWEARFE